MLVLMSSDNYLIEKYLTPEQEYFFATEVFFYII